MSNLTEKQLENRMILKHLVADARKPDFDSWSLDESWHKDLFPTGGKYKLAAMGAAELIEVAKSANVEAIQIAKKSLLHMGRAGMAMIALKEACKHGTFGSHLYAIGIEPRTAQNYMAIARNYETVSHLRGVKDALRYIRDATTRANQAEAATEEEWTIQGGPLLLDIGQEDKPSSTPLPSIIIEAEVVEPQEPEAETEDQEPEPLVIDGTKPAAPSTHNPWETSRRIIALLDTMEPKSFKPLCDIVNHLVKKMGKQYILGYLKKPNP